jgi:transposase
MVKSRPNYSKEFKLRACREVESGSTIAEVSRRLQIHPRLLYRWSKQFRQNPRAPFARSDRGRTPDRTMDPSAERIAELERLVGHLTLEVEFLKKTLRAVEDTFGPLPRRDGTQSSTR